MQGATEVSLRKTFDRMREGESAEALSVREAGTLLKVASVRT
jgi:hypothetical protein